MPPTTVAALISPRHSGNNFDFVRIVAAALVLISHHFALTGQYEPSIFGVHSLGGMAVAVFFIISGYLVTESWQRDPCLWRFAARRFLRIWPALTAVILLTAYGLGAWLTELPLREYLAHGGTTQYLRGLWLQIQFVLPGVFVQQPYPLSVNGSLWTIPIEVRCYIGLAIAGMLGLLRLRWVFLLSIGLYFGWFFAQHNADAGAPLNYVHELTAFFAAGAALQCTRDRWTSQPMWWGGASLALAVGAWLLGWPHTAILLGLPFLVVYLSTRSTPWLRSAGRWGDPSYGMYLFAFPVQQAVIQITGPAWGFASSLLLSIAITVALAYASWHLIEKQALKWKPSSRSTLPFASVARALHDWQVRHVPWRWFWPLLACAFGAQYILKRMGAPVSQDALVTYLPAAKAFLEQGWSYLVATQQDHTTPLSYFVAPLSYLWPALWGADPQWIRLANLGLWIGCVCFLWRTCCMLGGIRAGAVAMLLLLHPVLLKYFPSELTEPVFLFGLFGWMHVLARIVVGREFSRSVVVQGAAMLAITLLSRPVLQLTAPLLLVSCIGYLMFQQKKAPQSALDPTVKALAWSIALGLALPAALLVKNGLVYDLWSLGTGSGVGLYLGTHPLYLGAEPGFLGFGYDVNNMVWLAKQAGSHLSLDADRAARAAALWQIQSMPFADAFTYFGRKLWWWIAHHPTEIDTSGSALRKLRFLELLAVFSALVGAAWVWTRQQRLKFIRDAWIDVTPRQWILASLFFGIFVAMLAQLLPILYNERYSTYLLDPWLIPLTALALARWTAPVVLEGRLSRTHWSMGLRARGDSALLTSLGVVVLIVAVALTGYNLARSLNSFVVDPYRMGSTHAIVDVSSTDRLRNYALQPQGTDAWVVTETPAVLRASVTAQDVERIRKADVFNGIWTTDVAVKTPGASCRYVEVAYETDDGAIWQPANKRPLQLRLRTDGQFQKLATHANQELRPAHPGSLRLIFHCPVGTSIKWRGTQFLESRHAWEAAGHTPP